MKDYAMLKDLTIVNIWGYIEKESPNQEIYFSYVLRKDKRKFNSKGTWTHRKNILLFSDDLKGLKKIRKEKLKENSNNGK